MNTQRKHYLEEILDNKLIKSGINTKHIDTINKLELVYTHNFNMFDNIENKLVIEYLNDLEDINIKRVDKLSTYFKFHLIMNSF